MANTSDEEDADNRPDRRNFVLWSIVIGAIAVVAMGMGSMVVLALYFPWAVARREQARRNELKENLRQLGIALHNYNQTHQQQPQSAAVEGVSSDKE